MIDNDTAARLDELLDEIANVYSETLKEADGDLGDRFWNAMHRARQLIAGEATI